MLLFSKEEKMKEIYQEIAELIDETIPEEWKNVKLYVEGWKGYSTAYFYYYPESSEKPILSYSIPERFAIDKMEFHQQERKIRRTALSLQKAFESDGQEPWTNFTFILNRNGTFHVDYGYEDLTEADPGEQREAWKAKYGID
ncbi:hypothetical protein AV656_13145 [Bhargavaea cecembensis]|uniref:Cytoplasmic protein n=2 Tax=Bhargavaea cecembensis TaxID=394098 RepID=A0A161RD60_9BACL|nr:hypothetical protein AV656_13145 [Bhargavaea cecembensis]